MTITTWASLNNVTWTSLDGTPWTGGPLLPDELSEAQFIVEIAWGANVTADPGTWAWFEVTSDVLQSPAIRIQIAKQQENQLALPGSCTFTLRNNSNAYTPYAPLCSNYPNVKEGTPVRVKAVISSTVYILFQGSVVAFMPAWDETGNYAVTNVQAAGPSRVDAKKTNTLASSLLRAVPSLNPISYIPLEDGSTSTSFVSGLPGGASVPIGATPAWKLAAKSGAPGSGPLPELGFGSGTFGFATGPVPVDVDTQWSICFISFCDLNNAPSASLELWNMFLAPSGSWGHVFCGFDVSTGGFIIGFFNTSTLSDEDVTYVPASSLYDGLWHAWQLSCQQSGSNVNLTLYLDGANVFTHTYTSRTLSHIVQQQFVSSYAESHAVGHVAIFNNVTQQTAYSNAAAGHAGEAPNTRAARLCAENDVAFSTVGFYATDVTMGAQGIDTLLNLLRQCELADGGVLYDGQSAGYQLQGISQRYDQASQFTVNASTGQVMPPWSPTADDLTRVNSATISRINGSTVTYSATTGPFTPAQVGTYSYQPNAINYQTDGFIVNRARWEVHKGTIEGFRYPTVALNMRKLPALAAAVAAMVPGLSFTVTPPYSAQLPTDQFDLIAEGWTMTIVPTIQWDVAFNCSLQEAYNVWKIGDTQLGRLGTDGHTLAADAALGATSLSIATPSGSKLFTTAAGDFPMNLNISGLKIAVSNISGSSSPQTATVTGVTKALTNGSAITAWKNGVIKL